MADPTPFRFGDAEGDGGSPAFTFGSPSGPEPASPSAQSPAFTLGGPAPVADSLTFTFDSPGLPPTTVTTGPRGTEHSTDGATAPSNTSPSAPVTFDFGPPPEQATNQISRKLRMRGVINDVDIGATFLCTDEVKNGRPVFVKRGDDDMWLFSNQTGRWYMGHTKGKNSDGDDCFVRSTDPNLDDPTCARWMVKTGPGTWEEHRSVVVTAVDEEEDDEDEECEDEEEDVEFDWAYSRECELECIRTILARLPGPGGFKTGEQVVISGLKKAPELNEKKGTVKSFSRETGRYSVELKRFQESSRVVALKPANLSAAKENLGPVRDPDGTPEERKAYVLHSQVSRWDGADIEVRRDRAAELKAMGNDAFGTQDFGRALVCYSESVLADPDSQCQAKTFSNLAATLCKLSHLEEVNSSIPT